MHDSVGHELSLIALRAAALEIDAELPERQRRAAGELREAAATATERLGEIIGVLREPSAEATVIPARRVGARSWSSGQSRRGSRCSWSRRADGELAADGRSCRPSRGPGVTDQREQTRSRRRGHRHDLARAADEVVVTDRRHGAATRPAGGPRPPGEGWPACGSGCGWSAGVLRRRAAQRRWVRGGGPDAADRRARPEPSRTSSGDGGGAGRRTTRSARRGLITAVAAPLAVGAVIGVVALGYYLVAGYNSILQPAQYDDARARAARQRSREAAAADADGRSAGRPREPAQWSCRYYRPDAPF